MFFGMPTLLETKSLEECALLCLELGLKFVELNMNLPEYQVDKLDTVRLADIAIKYGIYYTIHLDENLNPCDFNERVSAAYTNTVIQAIDIAKKLNIPILNMHMNSGVYFTLPDKKVFLYDEYMDEYLERLTFFRNVCTSTIGNDIIKICVENCGDYARSSSFVKKGLNLLLESPVFGLTFDVGHNAAADYSDEPTIMENANRLKHFHIHDVKGRSNHLTLGDGDVDLSKYLELAKNHNCNAVIETKTVHALRQSVAWLKARKP